MKRFYLATCLLLLCFSITAYAQETQCGDGIDNDGDGFVDCYDGDCRQSPLCKDFYIGQDKACQVPPAGNAAFGMQLEQSSPDRTAWTSGRMAIGDLDGDGIPEVVSMHPDDRRLYILSGQTLAIKYNTPITGYADPYDIVIGDVKRDGCAEIFIAETENNRWYMSQYNCQGIRQWRVQVYDEPFTFGLADFDADGNAELYYRNEIMDAATGTIIVKGTGNWNSSTTGIDAGSVAVDILETSDCASCSGLELVVGGEIFSVNLATRAANSGSLTSVKKIPNSANYYPKYSTFGYINSMTSVVDFNQDGFLDVLVSGSKNSRTGTTSVFFWDVKNNIVRSHNPSTNWAHGTGRLNVADIDGDGKLNTTFVSGGRLFALKEDFTLLWSVAINEQTSGFTGATVFDFNNDKSTEVVYRDEQFLYIINGKNGSVLTQIVCRSRTADEYPIVADVDADGSTEICVTCNTYNTANVADVATRQSGQIRSFASSLEAWVPARRVWNQHGYFNVNVNDDLTIPVVQQKHHLSFSTGSPCNPGENRPLNTYLNQSPFLDSKGCPTYAAPDLIFDPDTPFNINSPTCPDKNFTVSFALKNSGNLGVSGSIPITFYSGNPMAAGAVKLNTVNVNLSNLNINDVQQVPNITVQGTGDTFVLYAVLNDNGSTTPTPITLPNNADFIECNFSNNILSSAVTPRPFQIVAELVNNNMTCTGSSPISNGAVQAYRLVNGVKTTANYAFHWFNGPTPGTPATAAYTGSVYTGLSAGTYSVFAVPTGFQCMSDAATVQVTDQAKTLSIAIVEDQPFTNCRNPDGKLHVVPEGGKPVGNYTYAWYIGTDVLSGVIVSKSYELLNAEGITYTVVVTEKATGCFIAESFKVTDNTVKPVVAATTTDANCSPANSGSASATRVGGSAVGYTFQWYNGNSVKPTVDFTGANYNNIPPGEYTVTLTRTLTGCVSAPVTVTVVSKTVPAITATVTANQTSCTPTPNGAATANINGATAGYTWRWFNGNNTLPANQIGTGASITGLAAGTVYTVQATDGNGCSNTATVTVTNTPVTLTVSTSVTNQTTCTPRNGSVTATAAGATGNIQYYWFNGNVGTPDTTAAVYKASATYSGLAAGYYTVVAVHKATRCASAQAVAQVLDNTVLPTVATTKVDQTSCNAATPNGSVSANVGGTTTGYSFAWYSGSAATGTAISTTATASNLGAGTYTVRATNTASGCTNTASITIVNNQTTPVASATANPLTLCSSANGSASANVSGATAGYTFYWFNGNVSTPNIASPNFTGATYSNLAAGYYTVVAVHTATQCQSAKVTVQVLDNTVLPAISTTKVDQTSCDTAAPNGSATANVGGTTTGYTFAWYAGSAATGATISTTASITNRAAGTYTVRVVNTATGCAATATITIINSQVTPTVSTTVTPLTVCSTPANGAATANVGGTTTGYTFYWFNGNVSSPAIGSANFTGAAYNNLAAGYYTVVAMDNVTKCQSAAVVVQVLNNTTLPTVTATKVDQTSCDTTTPNGSATANVGGTTTGYTFAWYAGSAATGATISTTASVSNLAAGTYTVRAVNTTSGCAGTATVTIVNNLVTPVASASAVPTTLCSVPANGSASANVGGATTGYTFHWFNGNVSSPAIGSANFTGATYSGLSAGYYTVVAVDNVTKCQSAKVTVQVTDNTVPFTVTAAKTDQTSCDTAAPNGTASANVSGGTTGYTFTWYAGSGTAGAVVSSTATASNLAAGTYTVRAVNTVSGCSNTAQVSVVNNQVIPAVTTTATPMTVCSTPSNGSASATVGGTTTGYTFYWFNGSVNTPIISSANFTGPTYSNLAAGSYTVVAVDNVTKCQSTRVVVSILDNTVLPVVSTSTVNQTSCDALAPNGSASANVGGATTGYTFTWHSGSGTGGAVVGTTATATGLAAGTYTVNVVNATTGCARTAQVSITNNQVIPVVSATATPLTVCSTPANGSASANVGGVTAGYTFYWFDGTVNTPNIASANYTGVTYSNRAPGSYTVVAVNDVTKCQSVRVTVTITDNTVLPTIATTKVDQTSCDTAAPNGSASANVGGTTTGYTFAWYAGTGTSGTALSTTATATGLAAGTYTVRAVNTATGCANTAQVSIVNNLVTPVVSATATPMSICSTPANGSASANVAGGTAGYTFYWFNGNVTSPNIATANFTGATYSNLGLGYYTVVAVDNVTKCQSARATVQVTDNTVLPTVATTKTDQTSCDTATPNATASANVGGTTTGYTFTWYAGAGTTGTVVGTTATATGLAAGVYTVRAVNTTTGCANTAQVSIVNNQVPPVVAASATPMTLCSTPSDGSASANVGGATAGYTFYWFNGNVSTPDIATASFSGATYNNLAAGAYTVVAVDNATKCQSARATVQVMDNTVFPTITTNRTSQTSCDISTPNGTASATVGGTTIGYTFTWYAGSGTTGTILSNIASASDLAAGTYTVQVVNDATGCTSTAQVSIVNNQVPPVVAASATPSTVCNVPGNGSATANVGGATTGYTFYWFNGNVNTPNITAANFTGVTYTNLSAGFYTVVAVDNATTCQSTKVTVQVLDNAVIPAPSATPISNTACDPTKSNGTISSNVGGVTAGYTFHVFNGQNTLAANEVAGSPAALLSGLAAGIYTVQAVNNTTGCAGTVEVTITNNIVLPTLTATAADVTTCAPPNGSITASVSIPNAADYTFSWFNGNAADATPDYPETSNVLSGVGAGLYTVSAFNNVLGCDVQNPFTVRLNNAPITAITIGEIPGERVIPAICNLNSGKLGVEASSAGNTLGYSFEWFLGDRNIGFTYPSEGPGINFPVNSNRIPGIVSGLHTVVVTDNNTGCFDSLTIHLEYSDEAALLSVLTFPQTNCAAPDGAFDATIDPSDGTEASYPGVDQTWYEIRVYQKGSLVLTRPGTNPSTVVSSLAAGNYTILAVETNPALPGCASNPNDITIMDAAVHPALDDVTIDNKNCVGAADGTGSIALTVDGTPTPASGYSYDWHNGKFMTGTALPAANTPAPGHTATNIIGGFYTVEVTNTTNSCTTTETFHINDDPYVIAIPAASLTLADQTDCNPVNGSAEVTDVLVDNVSAGVAGFTFNWLQSDGTTPIAGAGNLPLIGTALGANNYFVQTTNTTSNCTSPVVQFTIKDTTTPPDITGTTVNNTNCGGVIANGTVTISVNGGADPITDFTITWYEGTGTTTPLGTATTGTTAGTNNETAIQLQAGTYTVQVVDNTTPGTSCLSTATFTITDDPAVITIDQAAITLTHQTDCSPANGSAEVTDILVDGTALGNTTGYTFNWFGSNGTTLVAGAGNAATVGVALAAGNYYVQATNTATSCSSLITPFTINDIHVNPSIDGTIMDNTNCAGATANGTITIAVNGGADPITDFTITWYEGTGTTTVLGTATTGVIGGTNNETALQLPAGVYTVQVVDNTTPGTSCVSTATFTIADDPAVIAIDNADITLTHQADCTPADGSAEVTDVLVDGTAVGGTAGYTFTWLTGAGAPIAGSGNLPTIGVNLSAGDYLVQATNTTTNCPSAATPFTINDVHVDPAVTGTVTSNTNCSGVTANGTITVAVNGGTDPITDFTITWYEGAAVDPAHTLGTVTSGISGGTNNETASALPAGVYTVQVVDNTSPGTGCVAAETFTVTDDPAIIAIEEATITVVDQTDCTPANGTAEVTNILVDNVSTGGTAGYTFTWLASDGTTPITGAGTNALIGTNLAFGDYFVRATNTTTNCISPTAPFTIKDVHVDPAIDGTITNNTNCTGVTANGIITVTVNNGSDPLADFTITWYEGTGTGTPLGTATSGISGGANNETASALPAGVYTVQVVDNTTPGTGCVSTATFTVTDDPAILAIEQTDITLTHQADCTPADGSATVTDIIVDGTALGNTTDYTFTWLTGAGAPIAGAGNLATIGVNLSAGNYLVQATNTITNCFTPNAPFTINDIHVNPTIDGSVTDNSNCTGVTANGSITVLVNAGADPLADFTITWYEGTGTGTPLGTATSGISGGSNNQTASLLPAGVYTVQVVDNASPGTGCVSTATFTVTDDPAILAIEQADITLTHQADCTPADGSATVTDIIVDGTALGNTTDYTFTWLTGAGAPIAGSGNLATIGVNLSAGDYLVQATNTITNCFTPTAPFTINDIHVNPMIDGVVTNNVNCTGVIANGTITVSVDGGANPLADFTITWYEGTGTTTPLGTATTGISGGSNNQTASQLEAGFYTVQVIDNTSPGTGCLSTATFEVINDPAVIAIAEADIALTHQADCTPVDGSATVTDILIDGAGIGTTTGYTFAWFTSTGAPIAGAGNLATIGVNLGAGDYLVQATNTTTNCFSPNAPFTIDDVHVNPSIDGTITNNVNCVGTTANGTITVAINGGANPLADFTITWYEGTGTGTPLGTATTGVSGGSNNQTASQLEAGVYTVEVVDNTSPGNGCVSTATFTVTDDRAVIAVAQADIDLTHQADCTPVDGSAEVTDILVNGAGIGGVTGYTFAWFEADGTSPVTGAGNLATIGVNLGAGSYFVQATNTTTNCISPISPFTINDIHVDPAISGVTKDNENCTGVTADGTITITVNNGTNPITDFTITWYEGSVVNPANVLGTATTGTTAGTNNEIARQLPAGTYTAQVVDNTSPGNGCLSTATFTIGDDPELIAIDQAKITLTHQADCNPVDGGAQVTDVLVDGAAQGNTTGYTFAWFESDGTTTIPGSGNTANVGTILAAGDYYVQTTRTATNCISPITPFTINDIHVDPVVVIRQTAPNIACNTSYTGQLSASVTEGTTTGVITNYTFEWFRGANNTAMVDFISSGAVLANQQEGDYTVRVTDTSRPGLGCIGIATYYLRREIPSFVTTVVTTPQVLCFPVDSRATVTTITETLAGVQTVFDMSNPVDRARFTFRWTDDAGNTVVPPVNPNTITPPAGTYYVDVTNNLNCPSTATIAVVEDNTVDPIISLEAFVSPAVCVLPTTEGSLTTVVNNDPDVSADFTFTWHSGTTSADPVIGTATTRKLDGILPDPNVVQEFFLRVTDNTTRCFSDATYTVPTVKAVVQTLASSMPQTSCVDENGSLFASITPGTPSQYTYNWYLGNQIDPTTGELSTSAPAPIFNNSNEQPMVDTDIYTVVAVHPNAALGCVIMPDTTTVRVLQVFPMVNIVPGAPMTYCDPTVANGSASANVNGSIIDHTFAWYETATTNPVFATGPDVSNLKALTYYVVATDRISECTGTNNITIMYEPIQIPAPTIDVLSNHTDCQTPNGAVAASVGGETGGYIFNWYNGASTKVTADAIGENYRGLTEGNYTVTATDRVSGCISPPTTKPVLKLFVLPEFDVNTVATGCAQQNGTAELVALRDSDIAFVEWDINGMTSTGFTIDGLAPGTYSVKATSSLNCFSSANFTIKTEISVYNGISRNNDGMNEFFEIACLEDFPNNNVKIFNRAGTLVYEINGYNNQDVMFNGISNRGISVLGNELPEGTYFYIISKGDGSEPKTGYLELLR